MTTQQLIDRLAVFKPDTEVCIRDADTSDLLVIEAIQMTQSHAVPVLVLCGDYDSKIEEKD